MDGGGVRAELVVDGLRGGDRAVVFAVAVFEGGEAWLGFSLSVVVSQTVAQSRSSACEKSPSSRAS